jgi:hypothetical protein
MLRVTAGDHGFRSFCTRYGTRADFAEDPAQDYALSASAPHDPGEDDP